MKKYSAIPQQRNIIAAASVFAVAAALTAMAPPVRAAQADAPAEGEYARGRILVEPNAGVTVDQLEKLLKVHGGRTCSRTWSPAPTPTTATPTRATSAATARRRRHGGSALGQWPGCGGRCRAG
jgi:hypothetical protein